jgi:hypothetical protein
VSAANALSKSGIFRNSGLNIVTDLINALPGNGSVNTVQHATIDVDAFSMWSVSRNNTVEVFSMWSVPRNNTVEVFSMWSVPRNNTVEVFSMWSAPGNNMVEVFSMWSAPGNNTEALFLCMVRAERI